MRAGFGGGGAGDDAVEEGAHKGTGMMETQGLRNRRSFVCVGWERD